MKGQALLTGVNQSRAIKVEVLDYLFMVTFKDNSGVCLSAPSSNVEEAWDNFFSVYKPAEVKDKNLIRKCQQEGYRCTRVFIAKEE